MSKQLNAFVVALFGMFVFSASAQEVKFEGPKPFQVKELKGDVGEIRDSGKSLATKGGGSVDMLFAAIGEDGRKAAPYVKAGYKNGLMTVASLSAGAAQYDGTVETIWGAGSTLVEDGGKTITRSVAYGVKLVAGAGEGK
jgi:hypothetical protein